MATSLGRNAKLAVSTNGTTYNDLGEMKTCSLSADKSMADITSYDDAGWEDQRPVSRSVNVSFEMNYDESNVAQANLATAIMGESLLYFRYRPDGDGGSAKEIIFSGYPTGEINSDGGDVNQLSGECRSSSTVTYQTQT